MLHVDHKWGGILSCPYVLYNLNKIIYMYYDGTCQLPSNWHKQNYIPKFLKL